MRIADRIKQEQDQANVPQEDRDLMSLDANRYANCTGGRHCDGLETAWREYQRDGAEKYRAAWEAARQMTHYR